MIVGLLDFIIYHGFYTVSSDFWLWLVIYLCSPPFQGPCIFFHFERLYIGSHYDTTHVLSSIYWNTNRINPQ